MKRNPSKKSSLRISLSPAESSAIIDALDFMSMCGTKTAKVTWYLKKLAALSQVVKTCKVHRVNKFGRKPSEKAPPVVFCCSCISTVS